MDKNLNLNENSEMVDALKKFEVKSSIEQTQKSEKKIIYDPETPKMIGWVMKLSHGAIKKQKTAEYVLLMFALVVFLVSLFIFLGGNKIINKNKLEQTELLTNSFM